MKKLYSIIQYVHCRFLTRPGNSGMLSVAGRIGWYILKRNLRAWV
jgi:hypothetical protein